MSSNLKTAIGAALALTTLVIASPKARAACLTGSLPVDGNNCTSFDNASPSTATLRFEDPKLNNSTSPPRNGAKYFQLIFDPINGGPYQITNFEWSRGGDLNNLNAWSWTQFQSALQISSSMKTSTAIVDVSPAATTPLGNPFYVRYSIPAGILVNEAIDITFTANNDRNILQSVESGFNPEFDTLKTSGLNSGFTLTRDNTATTSVPAPMALPGLAIAISHATSLRRRINQQRLR